MGHPSEVLSEAEGCGTALSGTWRALHVRLLRLGFAARLAAPPAGRGTPRSLPDSLWRAFRGQPETRLCLCVCVVAKTCLFGCTGLVSQGKGEWYKVKFSNGRIHIQVQLASEPTSSAASVVQVSVLCCGTWLQLARSGPGQNSVRWERKHAVDLLRGANLVGKVEHRSSRLTRELALGEDGHHI